MSVLEKQLNLLKSSFPQATAPKVKAGKESFLFSAEKAGTLPIDDIYVIGMNGIQDLCEYDSSFTPFLSSLFSKSVMKGNRELQTKQENKELDEQIHRFFLLLGPYFQLRPAHMTVEYMIRRYKVHVYNVDSIMACILPYHGTLLFSRLVQILNISESKWHFLETVQTSASVLSRDTLVERCHTDFNILEFICETVQQCVGKLELDHQETLIGFFAAIVIEYIDVASNSQLKEVYLKRLFSYISSGIKSKDVNYQAASFMILTQIASKKALTAIVVDLFIEQIILHIPKYDPDHALLTLVFLCQSQKVVKLNAESFDKLLSIPNFTNKLTGFMKNYNISNFLDAFVTSLIEKSFKNNDLFLLEKYSTEINIEKQVSAVVVELFKLYSNDTEHESFVKQVLRVLDRRYPVQIDQGINISLQNMDDEEQQLVLKFTKLTFRGTQHDIVDGVDSSLFLCLEHQDQKVRLLALQKLKEIASADQLSVESQEFIAGALMRALLDENTEVIDTVLSFPNLTDTKDKKFITALTQKYLELPRRSPVRSSILKILSDRKMATNEHSQSTILPLVLTELFESDTPIQPLVQYLQNTNNVLTQDLFKKVSKIPKERTEIAQLVISAMSARIIANMDTLLPVCIDMFQRGLAQKVMLYVINHILSQKMEHKLAFCNLVLEIVSHANIPEVQYDAACLKNLLKGDYAVIAKLRVPDLLVYTYHNIIRSLPAETLDLNNSNDYSKLLTRIHVLITGNKHISNFTNHLEDLISIHLQSNALWFFSTFWSQSTSVYSQLVQERTLQIAAVLIEQSTADYVMLVPSLVANLGMNNATSTRQYALNCLVALNKRNRKAPKAVNPFAPELAAPVEMANLLAHFAKESAQIAINYHTILTSFSNLHAANLEFILKYITTPTVQASTKYLLLGLFANTVSETIITELSGYTLDLLESLQKEPVDQETYLQLERLGMLFGNHSTHSFTNGVRVLEKVLELNTRKTTTTGVQFIPTMLFARTFTNSGVALLPLESRTKLINLLTSIHLNSSEVEVISLVQSILKVVPITASFMSKLIPVVKKKSFTMEQMDELVNVLEVILLMENIPDKHLLIRHLFIRISAFEKSSFKIPAERIDYAINLMFTVLRTIVESFTKRSGSEKTNTIRDEIKKQFKIDVVINSLQQTSSPRIRTHAIVLIGELASLFPDEIMNHMVSVIETMQYAFQDGSRSTFQIIHKSVLSIVPQVLEKGTTPEFIFKEFVKCFSSIPEEKRMEFYTSLVKTTSRKNLHLFVLLLLLKLEDEENEQLVSFCHSFIEYFTIPKQLYCLIDLAKVALAIASGKLENEVFDVKAYSDEQRQTLLQNIIATISSHLTLVDFVKSLVSYEQENSKISQNYLTSLAKLLVSALCGRKKDAFSQEIESAFSKVQQLLNGASFITLIKSLMKNKGETREKALQILNVQLADLTPQSNKLIKNDKELFIGMITSLKKILKSEKEADTLKQSSVIGIELLARRFGKDVPESFVSCIPAVLEQAADTNMQLVCSTALCLGSLSAELELHVLQYLPSIIDTLVKLLDSTFDTEEKIGKSGQLLQLTSLSALELIAKRHLGFLSPYLSTIMSCLLNPILLQSNLKKLQIKSVEFLNYIATKTEARLVLDPIFETYEAAIMLGDASIKQLLLTLEQAIARMEFTDDSRTKKINSFLLRLFDHRRLHGAEDIDSIEQSISSLVKTYIVKLNENMFRPFLLDVIEWGRESDREVSEHTERDEYEDESEEANIPNIHRVVTFYKLINTTTETLKSIFVPYFSLLLEYCAKDLFWLNSTEVYSVPTATEVEITSRKRKREEISKSKKEVSIGEIQHTAILLIVSALDKCFRHDAEGFMNDATKVDVILQPLVDQLANLKDDSEEDEERYNIRGAAIAHCLGNMASVIPQTNWKALQTQVLQKTQHTTSPIKCAAISSLMAMYGTVGQEFVAMLPELLPYLAELLEDNDEVVVKQTQKLVQKVEDSCGEDLSRYMK